MSGLSEQQFDELADAIGAMPEAYNVTDYTDEQTTFIHASVEMVTETLAPVVARMIAEAYARGAADQAAKVVGAVDRALQSTSTGGIAGAVVQRVRNALRPYRAALASEGTDALAKVRADVVALAPAENIALTIGKAQVDRGDAVSPNVAAACVLTLARIARGDAR